MVDFVRPEFLWALPAAAVPVLIHILNRRRYRRVPWAAMQHLLRAERRSRRRIRWQDLLLLLMRVGAVVLLVVLFARPRSEQPVAGLLAPGANVVVLLDDSASMAQQEAGSSAFDKAKRFALSAARQLAGRDAALALRVASEEEPVLVAPALQPEDVGLLEDVLDGLRPGASVFEPGEALASLGRAAAGRAARPVFIVLTDLRAADWGVRELRSDARRALETLQESGPVLVVDFGAAPAENAGVTDLVRTDRLTYAQETAALRAMVQNDGRTVRPASGLNVRLDDGALPPVPTPELPPGEHREVPVEAYLESPGSHTVEVALSQTDSFPPDDRRFAALDAVRQVPVLVLTGDAGPDRPDGAAYYLRRALQPDRSAPSGIRPEIRRAGLVPPEDLESYPAVFACNVPSPAAWREAVQRYVTSGGHFVVFLGDKVDAQAWNATLFAESDGLLPCRIAGRIELGPAEAAHLVELDFSHPLLAPFTDWQTLFGMVRTTGFCALRPLGQTKVLARFDDAGSSPAILEGSAGRGSVLLFTTSADDAWTDWPRSEAGRVTYVALMHRLVERAAVAGRPQLNLLGGSRIEYRLDPSAFRPEARLRHAQGTPVPGIAHESVLRARPVEGREGLWLVSRPLTRAGIWQLELTAHDDTRRQVLFAVNIPDQERLLARTEPDLVKDAAAGGMLTVRQFSNELMESAFGEAARGRGYWRALAAAAIVVLLLDSLLAWAFGRPGRSLDAGGPHARRET